MTYEQEFLRALLCTLAVEVPIVFLLLKYVYQLEMQVTKIIFTGIVASTLTLPYLWFVLPAFIFDWTLFSCIGETAVIVVEAIIYKEFLNLTITQALVVSLVSNGASIIFGLLVL